jgi:hypothetical protein
MAAENFAKADNVSYTFYEVNSPYVGSFGWTVTSADLITTFTTFNEFNSSFPPSGCGISSVSIDNEPAIQVYTWFQPLCQGKYDGNLTGIPSGPMSVPGQYTGVYSIPNGSQATATLSVYYSDLPITTPEPNELQLLGTGLLSLVPLVRRKVREGLRLGS